ncbi:MAG TPA: sugar transferase [Bacteroidales bacterium]|nr:sugar transferase [Bacteroidales bacterium]HRZ49154.1 sugar transferase [Bacteroidales bacterium]
MSRRIRNSTKYLFDRVLSFAGLILLLPVLAVIALVILWRDGRPVFFIQPRVGRNGRLFRMVKFRTMRRNDGANTVSVLGDSRITPTGAWLRRHKLDELPELWNVLAGQMSLVGPRPDVPGYADRLAGDDRLILQLRPGITGPATLKYTREEELLAGVEDPVRYNNEVIWPDKVRINLAYYHHHNLFTDLKIIIKTFV